MSSSIAIKELFLSGQCPGPDNDLTTVDLVSSKAPPEERKANTFVKIIVARCETREGSKCLLSQHNLSCPFVEEIVTR